MPLRITPRRASPMDAVVRVVIQARMGSSRLPGKILASLAGLPLLVHVVRRLAAASADWQIVVATTIDPADDATFETCRAAGIACMRGAVHDVLGRYLAATADMQEDDIAVRATADNPLYCPARARELVDVHRLQRADYTSIDNLSYVVPECFRVGALRAMAAMAQDGECREHVTPFFRRRQNQFLITKLPAVWCGLRSDVRLTVDTPADLAVMRSMYEALDRGDSLFTLESVYQWCDLHGHAPRPRKSA